MKIKVIGVGEFIMTELITPNGIKKENLSKKIKLPLEKLNLILSGHDLIDHVSSKKIGNFFGFSDDLLFDYQTKVNYRKQNRDKLNENKEKIIVGK